MSLVTLQNTKSWKSLNWLLKMKKESLVLACMALLYVTHAPAIRALESDDQAIINQYIDSLGYSTPIVFDASNIKQYWIEKTVFSKDNNINILLHFDSQGYKSDSFKIQLANINELMDCTIDAMTEDSGISFSVINKKDKELTKSSFKDDFITYKIYSAAIHLEDVQDDSLYLVFSSDTQTQITIKNIVISFSKNDNAQYLMSPGILKLEKDNTRLSNTTLTEAEGFEVKGKRTGVFSQKKIIVSDALKISGKIKNTGDAPTKLYVGFLPYFKNGDRLKIENYPYKKNSEVLTVVSSQDESNEIVVDSCPEWRKSCHIALNAQEDMKDVPNTDLVDGTITDLIKLDDGKGKIVLDKPLKKALVPGQKIRIHGPFGGGVYLFAKVLNPGEEVSIESEVRRDNNHFVYSAEALSQGIYYVVPVIYSNSVDSNVENSILINDIAFSY